MEGTAAPSRKFSSHSSITFHLVTSLSPCFIFTWRSSRSRVNCKSFPPIISAKEVQRRITRPSFTRLHLPVQSLLTDPATNFLAPTPPRPLSPPLIRPVLSFKNIPRTISPATNFLRVPRKVCKILLLPGNRIKGVHL